MQGGAALIDAAEALRVDRLWTFFNIGHYFWPIRDWPRWAQELALSRHLDYNDRYRLFYFYASNGLAPDLTSDWMLTTDVEVHGGGSVSLSHEGYDDEASRHVHTMMLQFINGDLFKNRKTVAFDMRYGRLLDGNKIPEEK